MNAGWNLGATFYAAPKTGNTIINVPGIALIANSPNCQVVSNSGGSFTWTVNNDTAFYAVEVDFGGATNNTIVLNSVRVGYKLQISPDPSTATFTDVPVGSIYHRFVEALVAAAITGGCGGGNYCPDAAVTRGQIAVLLSAALGLHWAP